MVRAGSSPLGIIWLTYWTLSIRNGTNEERKQSSNLENNDLLYYYYTIVYQLLPLQGLHIFKFNERYDASRVRNMNFHCKGNDGDCRFSRSLKICICYSLLVSNKSLLGRKRWIAKITKHLSGRRQLLLAHQIFPRMDIRHIYSGKTSALLCFVRYSMLGPTIFRKCSRFEGDCRKENKNVEGVTKWLSTGKKGFLRRNRVPR